MSEIWKHTAILRTGVLLIDETRQINLSRKQADISISFAPPKPVENVTWPGWDHAIPYPGWDYGVTVCFSARDANEADSKAWRKLESIAARLSFLGSGPVMIQSYGSITNAPQNPVKGTDYTIISLTFDQAWEGRKPPVINQKAIKFLKNILIPDVIAEGGTERIERSMRWLQHSYHASTATDEFTCLILAFEAISHLLRQPEPSYWRCSSCKENVTQCPKCGASSERKSSGAAAMQAFVHDRLGWSLAQWQKIWELRNRIVHGGHDLSSQDEQIIPTHLPKLEEAVVTALRHLLGLPQDAPPYTLRQRCAFFPFYGAKLHAQWHLKEK